MNTSNDMDVVIADGSRWRSFLRRLQTLIELRWPVVAYRTINICVLIALGAMIEHAALSTFVVVFSSYLTITALIEFGLAETSKDIERRVNESVEKKYRRIGTELESYAAAENFLTTRLRRNTGAISILRKGDRELIGVATGSIAKVPAINETLRDLCESLSATCSKERNIPRPDAWFRATYMEVQGTPRDEKLVYIGWHTVDGNPPRSMRARVTYQKREGDAGLAWERGRPVIEDFKDKLEWKENYPGQSSNYTSMICVPVLQGYGTNMGDVIGIITVDTHVDLYFGDKNDRGQEDKIARLIRPYGTYIAFVSAVDAAVNDLVARLGAPVSAEVTTDNQLAIAAPHADVNSTRDDKSSQ